jgi:hypothetical protein
MTATPATALDDEPVEQPPARAPRRAAPTRVHHATTPLVLCVLGYLLWIAAWAMAVIVALDATSTDNQTSASKTPRAVGAIALLAACMYVLGWLWWGIAASFNARTITWKGVAWWTAPVTYLLAIAVLAAPRLVDGPSHREAVSMLSWFVAWGLHLWVLSQYRRTADEIHSNRRHFTRLMWLPLLGGVVAVPVVIIVFPVLLVVLAGMAVSTYGAMHSWNAAVVRLAPTPTTSDTNDVFFRAALD